MSSIKISRSLTTERIMESLLRNGIGEQEKSPSAYSNPYSLHLASTRFLISSDIDSS